MRKLIVIPIAILLHFSLFASESVITTTDSLLSITIENKNGIRVKSLVANGRSCLSESGAYTGYISEGTTYTSLNANKKPSLESGKNRILIKGISYGAVEEEWIFSNKDGMIKWEILRRYLKETDIEKTFMPCWQMKGMDTWKGGILDNGGVVWCKYLHNLNDSYGVHTSGVTLWNPDNNHALRISAQQGNGLFGCIMFTHAESDEFQICQMTNPIELFPKHMQNRCLRGQSDVFLPYHQPKGEVSVTITLHSLKYDKAYPVGRLQGMDSLAVRELMNTTGRYGVVDNGIVGANGWLTNWKCLHEPFFSQIGLAHLALLDDNYIYNMKATLDRERLLAISSDGRVASRWHGDDTDQMPGTYNYNTGYYEAVWGYTVDSQTGYVINTVELFDLNGDTEWLNSHKSSCEKVLDWLIRRDSNGNGIFEMMNNHIGELKSSDWLDIVLAGFENAFVNAQMFEALKRWSECERILDDSLKANYYSRCASELKKNFNKDIKDGGFWCHEKKQYIYWRDNDNSIHGFNLVTPVNLAVIAYGLCDDKERVSIILDEIERRNTAENLFHWPLCYDSYQREEVLPGNWPFPNYENGDIFPTWGYLGIRAYAGYDRNIALKYIRNLLRQYREDGLSSQRYGRITQKGQGTDILAGICTTITALYRDIYGIRPHWNRLGLEPHLLPELHGTEFSYLLRGETYDIKLNEKDYILDNRYAYVRTSEAIGLNVASTQVKIYCQNKEERTLIIKKTSHSKLYLEVKKWDENVLKFRLEKMPEELTITGLQPRREYTIASGRKINVVNSSAEGVITISRKKIDTGDTSISLNYFNMREEAE